MERLLTPKEAASTLGITAKELSSLVADGLLTPIRLTSKITRYSRAQVGAYWELRRVMGYNEEGLWGLSKRAKRITGVYFLMKNRKVVYVGQSVHIPSRIDAHLKNCDTITRDGFFDTYTYIECQPEHMDMMEAYFIKKFKPIYNVANPAFTTWLLR